jgi:uncharacterized protein DUF1569
MRTLSNEQDCQELIDRVNRLGPDARARWGRMSAHQMICHCCDTFRMASGERPLTSRVTLLKRKVLMWGALYLPIPWPRGFRTRRELDQERGGTPPEEFEADRAQLTGLIQRFAQQKSDFGQHVLFGPMARPQWMRWAFLHTDHHCRQFGI